MTVAHAPRCSSTVNAPRCSSTVAAIDKQRRAAKLSHEQFCQRAGISYWTWRDHLRGRAQPNGATLQKYREALVNPPREPAPGVIAGAHRLAVVRLASAHGVAIEQIDAQDLSVQRPRNANWLLAARLNRMAIYILTVELQMENADVAAALGCTRQNVAQARDAVEEWRDEPTTQRLIAKVSLELAGRGE